jgi:hypothetical protein
MDISGVILAAALFSILANALKVWEFVSPRLFKKIYFRLGVLPLYKSKGYRI